MTYDDLMDGREQQLAREEAAEARRLQREASTAFAARLEREARTAPSRRTTVLSARRQAEVTLARAIVAALPDVYGAGAYALGGAL